MNGTCDACLRRGYLVGLLAGRIQSALGRPDRPAGVLALEDHELAAALDSDGKQEALAFLGRFEVRRARADLRAAGVAAVCRHHEGFPALLRELADPPAVLFCRGRTELLASADEQPAITIVGTRDPTPYGIEQAGALGRGVAAAGLTVVSGMALGVDGAAHRGALAADGDTVAVLAGGPDYVYPRRHRDLHREIAARGLLVSELPPGQRPYRWSFPARNRIMAALGRMTVVVEAAAASGTLITAGFATQLDRVVGALPGRVTTPVAAGANALLRDGAALVRDAADVLDEVFGAGAGEGRLPVLEPPRLDPVERRLLDAVESGADLEASARHAGVGADAARLVLARLELRGIVRRDGLAGWAVVAPMLPRR
ncbi:MAG: DNA-protecting protein DprA [Solirubrobacterales bacterium]|nr:DNA-protecting protein DprA [Solirubrobacterales bacterium]